MLNYWYSVFRKTPLFSHHVGVDFFYIGMSILKKNYNVNNNLIMLNYDIKIKSQIGVKDKNHYLTKTSRNDLDLKPFHVKKWRYLK